jgi:hypothetical protein
MMRSMCVWVSKLAGVLREIDPQCAVTITTDAEGDEALAAPRATRRTAPSWKMPSTNSSR